MLLAFLGAFPAAVTLLGEIRDAIKALTAEMARANAQAEVAAISKAQADTAAAKTTDDYKKAADETAKAIAGL